VFSWLRQRHANKAAVEAIYERVVAAARRPHLYSAYGVPDTVEGRYEMVVAHLVVVLERLRAEGDATAPLTRDLIERFVTDMDDCMREIGVGDLSVGKKVRRAAAGLWERAEYYRRALAPDADGAALEVALAAAFPAGAGLSPPADAARLLAAELRAIAAGIADTELDAIIAGEAVLEPARSGVSSTP
jgi:cytochrome b pre-mRNA-processing protein 3